MYQFYSDGFFGYGQEETFSPMGFGIGFPC